VAPRLELAAAGVLTHLDDLSELRGAFRYPPRISTAPVIAAISAVVVAQRLPRLFIFFKPAEVGVNAGID
jgi:hypothetical protein